MSARIVSSVADLRELPDGTLIVSGDRYRMYAGAVWRVHASAGMVERVGQEREGVTPFRYFVDPLPAVVMDEASCVAG